MIKEGGGEEGKRGKRRDMGLKGKEGGKIREKGGRKGVRKDIRKTLIVVPLWFRSLYQWGQNYYIPFLSFWGIIFGNSFQETLQHNFLGELITVM